MSNSTLQNLQTLTIFICHLLNGGDFYLAHFRLNSTLFEANFIRQVNCFDNILCLTSDLTSKATEWNHHRVLELNFLTATNDIQQISYSDNDSELYRIFIFVDETNIELDLILEKFNLTAFKKFNLTGHCF